MPGARRTWPCTIEDGLPHRLNMSLSQAGGATVGSEVWPPSVSLPSLLPDEGVPESVPPHATHTTGTNQVSRIVSPPSKGRSPCPLRRYDVATNATNVSQRCVSPDR